jgi:hypothetical protein
MKASTIHQKKIIIITINIFAFIYTTSCLSQFSNSEQTTIYNVVNASVDQVALSGGELSLNIRLKKWDKNVYVYTKANDTSALKKHIIALQLGAVNTTRFLDIDALDFDNLGYKIGLEYRYSMDEIFIQDGIKPVNNWVFTGGLEYKADRFRIYDPVTSETSLENPSTISINGSTTYYILKKYRNHIILAPTLTTRYNISTYNSNELINVVDLNQEGLIQDTNAIGIKDFSGKFGTISTGESNITTSFSFPFIINKKIPLILNGKLPYLIIIPHISHRVGDFSPIQNKGFSIGFLGGSVFTEDPDNSSIRKFAPPSFLTFGVDWTSQSNVSSKPNWFLTGSFSFGK